MRQRLAWSAAIAVVAVLALPPAAPGAEPPAQRQRSWMLGAGIWGPEADESGSLVVDLEHRWPILPYGVFLTAGALANSDGGLHVRSGFGRSFVAGRWQITPVVAFGLYEQGDSEDLGHVVEFRSALEVTYRVRRGVWAGLSYAHLSNASISDQNPGIETVTAVVVWRPRRGQ